MPFVAVRARPITAASVPAVLLLTACVAATPPAHADAANCPAASHGASLNTAMVLDGPPEQLADLAPDRMTHGQVARHSEWDVAYIFAAGRRVYVRCDYGPGAPAVVVEPPTTTTRCAFTRRPDETASLACTRH